MLSGHKINYYLSILLTIGTPCIQFFRELLLVTPMLGSEGESALIFRGSARTLIFGGSERACSPKDRRSSKNKTENALQKRKYESILYGVDIILFLLAYVTK